MERKTLQRNSCIIWHREPEGDSIFTCLKEKENFIILRGFQAWLWLKLSRPYTIDELKELLREQQVYAHLCDKLEEIIKPLLDKKILKYTEEEHNQRKSDIPQRYKEVYVGVLQELNSAKKFSKSEDLNIYHKDLINTSERHFEEKEVTVSHTYRHPHIALGGLSYGAKLYRRLNALKKITPEDTVVEVGAGLGYLARSFLDEYKRDNNSPKDLRYICCDLTFKFIESQRKVNIDNGHIGYCQLNAEKMPFKDNSIDLMIANENIADFTAVKLNKRTVLDYLNNQIDLDTIKDNLIRRSLEWIKFATIDVQDGSPDFIFNLGAIEFINEIKRVLQKGGLAFVAEYGIMQGYPTAVYLSGHVEYSIQFAHLLKIIEALGMNVEVTNLLDFLEFKKDVEVVDACSLGFLCGLLRERGIELPCLAYTREMIEEIAPNLLKEINNLRFFRIADKSYTHQLDKFYVLLIRKR